MCLCFSIKEIPEFFQTNPNVGRAVFSHLITDLIIDFLLVAKRAGNNFASLLLLQIQEERIYFYRGIC